MYRGSGLLDSRVKMNELIKPNENETLQEYTARFMSDPECIESFKSERDRKIVATHRYAKFRPKQKAGEKRGK